MVYICKHASRNLWNYDNGKWHVKHVNWQIYLIAIFTISNLEFVIIMKSMFLKAF